MRASQLLYSHFCPQRMWGFEDRPTPEGAFICSTERGLHFQRSVPLVPQSAVHRLPRPRPRPRGEVGVGGGYLLHRTSWLVWSVYLILVVRIFNPSTQQFKASQGYIVRRCL